MSNIVLKWLKLYMILHDFLRPMQEGVISFPLMIDRTNVNSH